MDITPDLSHLTEYEKRIIENVMNRYAAEEEFDAVNIESHTSPAIVISHHQHLSSIESGAVCQICHKTKFVNDQSSRQCSICQKNFCVRCGIRLKSQIYVCQQCQQKQEHYFSSTNNKCKQYLSDYILSQTHDEKQMNKYGANNTSCSLKPIIPNEDEISSIESIATCDDRKRLVPPMKQTLRSTNILREFQYHSLDERDLGQESTLKDSGIDTASSSTILNAIATDQSKKTITSWHSNDNRTEQIGHVYLKNNFSTHEHGNDEWNRRQILKELGFDIENDCDNTVKISKVIPDSIADIYGRLKMGDQILEWNGKTLKNRNLNEINRIISQYSMDYPQIYLLAKRLIKTSHISQNDGLITNNIVQEDKIIPSTIENKSIQLQLSFQYVESNLHIMIYGARNIPVQQGLLACQLSLQYGRDTLSTIEKCTKAQSCSSDSCVWNQRIVFFDVDTIENILLIIKLIDLEHNQDILAETQLNKLNLNNTSEWFYLTNSSNGSSFNSMFSEAQDTRSATIHIRRRQLPDIPASKLHANRERVSQDLLEKATQLKLRLHMKTNSEGILKSQHSFDQTHSHEQQRHSQDKRLIENDSRKSMINLSSKSVQSKPRLSLIRDTSVPNSIHPRRTTIAGRGRVDLEKTKFQSFDEKHRSLSNKQCSFETSPIDVDSDVSEISASSKISAISVLSTQSERPRTSRKSELLSRTYPRYLGNDQSELSEEELRQIAMRTIDRQSPVGSKNTTETNANFSSSSTATNDKIVKIDHRSDGTVSDSALSNQLDSTRKGRPSMSSKALVILGLSRKANSASSFSSGRRYCFQRSEEIGVQPHLRSRTLQRQMSKENKTPSSVTSKVASLIQSTVKPTSQNESQSESGESITLWSGALNLPHEHHFSEFIEGLGTGQLVGRQVLASPCHGEIQIGLRDQNGFLELEIVRARNLLHKTLNKTLPAPYVKVYLLDGKICLEKQRTRTARRTLEPLIQETLLFKEDYRDRVLQINVWGDYGKLDRKIFMGVCQIGLREINLNSCQQMLDWYKLFSTNSLMNSYMNTPQSSRKSVTTIND